MAGMTYKVRQEARGRAGTTKGQASHLMTIIVDGKKTKAASAATVAELISSLKLNGEEVLVKVNGKLAPNGAAISSKDDVKIMRVIFGG